MQPRIWMSIPACNEDKNTAVVLAGLRRAAPAFERIVINDGAKDTTGAVVAVPAGQDGELQEDAC